MKTNIFDYPSFMNAIKNDSLVYLFGTGMSAALTGKPYSWWKWIMDGIHCLKDTVLADEYQKSLQTVASTANMIDLAGKVLTQAKAEGTYDDWMKAEFETNLIADHELALTLKKMLVLQDVFVTTNYDLLLEQATGLGSLTYEEPDLAFSMLDRHTSTHVLHIHGLYDSSSGKDNIIADKEQYEAVIANKGAQFIQEILGTRTVVFIGCGKTTEDVNISRFIRFANEYLKMDQTYFFLYNQNYPVEDLPVNIVPIPYGDDYADLPGFLEDMAQIRIRNRIAKHSLIGQSVYQQHDSYVDPLLRYHYSQQILPFCGRQRELAQLQEFLCVSGKFLWWSVTGQAGAGKSRLALEFLNQLPTSWFGFFVSDKATEKDIEEFKPFAHTVMVIDYVAGRERYVAELMRKMAALFSEESYMLRILLIEREDSRAEGTWYQILLQRFGKYERFVQLEYRDRFLNLTDLDEAAVDELVGCICGVNGLAEDHDRDIFLRKAYGQKFEKLQFRPLFVQLFVEAWIDNDFTLPRYDDFEDVLRFVLKREQERWLSMLDGNHAVCNAFIHLLLRANISGALNVKDLPELYRKDWGIVSDYISAHSFPGKQRAETQRTLINYMCQNVDETNQLIAPLFPDIIKEYMFSFYMEEERLPDMMSEIWQNAAHDFSVFITRCMTDFPENECYSRALNVYQKSANECEVLLGRLELLRKWELQEGDDPYVLLDIIANEYEFWKAVTIPENVSQEEAEKLATLKVTGLNMVAMQFGGWSLYDMSDMVAVAKEALEVKGGPAVDMIKQFYLHRHITELSKAGFADEAAQLRQKMTELIAENEQDAWNAHLEMSNMNSEMMCELFAEDIWSAYQTLKKMNEKCMLSSIEAARILAQSGFNFDQFSFMLEQKKYIGRGLDIVQKIETLYPDDWEIRARKIGCQGSILQFHYFYDKDLSEEQLGEKLEPLKTALATMSFTNEHADQALGISWGLVYTLSLNVIKNDEMQLRKVIDEAEEILKINSAVTEVAATEISAVRALHREIFHTKISHDEVEALFRYVEKNYESGSLRNEFFEMLEESEDAGKRENYLTKWVAWGARQDAKYNPIMGSGVDEIDEEEALYRMLAAYQPEEPYRREHRKIGANEPCPCGSGKKFKKCCRGNGRYD